MKDKKRFVSLHYYGDEKKPPRDSNSYPFGFKLHDGTRLFPDFRRGMAERWVRRINKAAKAWDEDE